MKVLVDTCIWSYALRRSKPSSEQDQIVREFRQLIRDGRVQMAGPVRQEILSGIRDAAHYGILRDHLRDFPDLRIESGDYERAAEMCNGLRAKGIQGSNTDFLLCSLSERTGMPIFTIDDDFKLFTKYLPVKLYKSKH
ncbi:MAG: PIN domain-containing protein [Nitrospirota bacterium]